MGMSVTLAQSEGLPVLSVAGELDWLACEEFEDRILEAAHGCDGCVVVDLSDVTYIESSPLGVLIKLHIVLAREGGDLAVVCRGAHVTRMVKELGIGHILPIFVDQATAVASLLPLIAESH